MEKFLNRMERKFGKYAIHNLMFYIIGVYVVGAILGMFDGGAFYYQYLSLDFSAILRGQVWRIITFILTPDTLGSVKGFNVFFFLITLYFYWIIGRNLENVWGAFRFNMYYLSGILLNIVAALIMYLITKDPTAGWYFGMNFINQSLLLAFCAMFPDNMVLFMFVIPLKMKYLGIFYGAMLALNIIQALVAGSWYYAVAIIVALANFFLFFFSSRKSVRPFSSKINSWKRRQFHSYTGGATGGSTGNVDANTHFARHRCAICGRTEISDPDLEFRFCSKCEGNYEYCSDHLYTHQHIQKVKTESGFGPDTK